MASSCSPDLLCLLPSLSDHALPLQRKTKAPTVRWIWSTITKCCRGLIYLQDPLLKTAPRKYCKPTPQFERAIPGQFSQLLLLHLLLKLRPGNPSVELAQILIFLLVLPLQTSFLGSTPMGPHPFPNPVSLTLRQRHTPGTFSKSMISPGLVVTSARLPARVSGQPSTYKEALWC